MTTSEPKRPDRYWREVANACEKAIDQERRARQGAGLKLVAVTARTVVDLHLKLQHIAVTRAQREFRVEEIKQKYHLLRDALFLDVERGRKIRVIPVNDVFFNEFYVVDEPMRTLSDICRCQGAGSSHGTIGFYVVQGPQDPGLLAWEHKQYNTGRGVIERSQQIVSGVQIFGELETGDPISDFDDPEELEP